VRDVLAGRIVACRWVKLACERHELDLRRAAGDPDCSFRFDAWHANDVCDFVEKLPHIEGDWDTPTIRLEGWQVFILISLFAWRRKSDGHRRFNTGYFEVARKNAKSTLASAIALYCLTCEGENGPQVKCGATTGSQARIVFDVSAKMAERTPSLREAFGLEVLANAVMCHQSGGSIAPINAKASTQDGLNPHCSIIDELHAHKDRKLFDVLKSARGARKNPLSFYPTTAGYNMLGVCYEQRTFVTKILLGVFEPTQTDHYFGIIYTLDDEDKDQGIPADDPYDERVWIKANPNLGVSVQLHEMRGFAAEASLSPDSEGEFKTKRLNMWLNAAKAWLNMTQWAKCGDESISLDSFAGQRCWIGGDLAQLDDIAAVALLFERGDILYAFTKFYLPRLVVEERAKKVPAYQDWVNKGILELTDGNMIDYGKIEADIRGWCKRFSVQAVVFDQFGSGQITGNLAADGIPAEILPKNAKTFTPPARDLETRVRHGQFRHDGNRCITWMASNAVVTRKIDDSILPKKEHADSPNKIDGIDAILQANGAFLVQPVKKQSVYATRGVMVV
jgi:phage terminase large subunit-like protein